MPMYKEIINNKLYEEIKNNIDKINFHLKENKCKEASSLCNQTLNIIKNYKLSYGKNKLDFDLLLYNLYHIKINLLDTIQNEEKFLYMKNALDIVLKTDNFKWIVYEYRNYISELLKIGKIKEALKTYRKFQKVLSQIKEELRGEKLKEMLRNNAPIQNIIKETGYTEEKVNETKKIMILVREACAKNKQDNYTQI